MAQLRLAGVFLRISFLSELAYRASFFVSLLQSLVNLALTLGGLALVYLHTDSLAGWSANELLMLLGIYYLMGGVIETFVQPSMSQLLQDVRKGTLDFVLTKPEDAQLLASVRSFAVWNLTNALLGLGLMGAAIVRGEMTVGGVEVAFFVAALLCGAVIVYSFWLILATTSFWFVKVENILVIFQSLYEAGRWPVSIYPAALRTLLTFLVPVAFAVTVPAEALTGRITWGTMGGALALAVFFFAVARWFFQLGVRRYSGASA